MAKANLKTVSSDTPLKAINLLLNEMSGDFGKNLLRASEAVEVIAELLHDNCQFTNKDERMTDNQVAGLCGALTIVAKWQTHQACSLADRADDAAYELEMDV